MADHLLFLLAKYTEKQRLIILKEDMPKDLTFLLLPQVTKANTCSEHSPLISSYQIIFFAQPFSLWLSVPVKIYSSPP